MFLRGAARAQARNMTGERHVEDTYQTEGSGQREGHNHHSPDNDFVAWVELLPQEHRNDYLVYFAQNEPGLSRLLVKKLRELGQSKAKATPSTGEHVTYATLLTESRAMKGKWER